MPDVNKSTPPGPERNVSGAEDSENPSPVSSPDVIERLVKALWAGRATQVRTAANLIYTSFIKPLEEERDRLRSYLEISIDSDVKARAERDELKKAWFDLRQQMSDGDAEAIKLQGDWGAMRALKDANETRALEAEAERDAAVARIERLLKDKRAARNKRDELQEVVDALLSDEAIEAARDELSDHWDEEGVPYDEIVRSILKAAVSVAQEKAGAPRKEQECSLTADLLEADRELAAGETERLCSCGADEIPDAKCWCAPSVPVTAPERVSEAVEDLRKYGIDALVNRVGVKFVAEHIAKGGGIPPAEETETERDEAWGDVCGCGHYRGHHQTTDGGRISGRCLGTHGSPLSVYCSCQSFHLRTSQAGADQAEASSPSDGPVVSGERDPLSVACPVCARPAGWTCVHGITLSPRDPHPARVALSEGEEK